MGRSQMVTTTGSLAGLLLVACTADGTAGGAETADAESANFTMEEQGSYDFP